MYINTCKSLEDKGMFLHFEKIHIISLLGILPIPPGSLKHGWLVGASAFSRWDIIPFRSGFLGELVASTLGLSHQSVGAALLVGKWWFSFADPWKMLTGPISKFQSWPSWIRGASKLLGRTYEEWTNMSWAVVPSQQFFSKFGML